MIFDTLLVYKVYKVEPSVLKVCKVSIRLFFVFPCLFQDKFVEKCFSIAVSDGNLVCADIHVIVVKRIDVARVYDV